MAEAVVSRRFSLLPRRLSPSDALRTARYRNPMHFLLDHTGGGGLNSVSWLEAFAASGVLRRAFLMVPLATARNQPGLEWRPAGSKLSGRECVFRMRYSVGSHASHERALRMAR